MLYKLQIQGYINTAVSSNIVTDFSRIEIEFAAFMVRQRMFEPARSKVQASPHIGS